MPSTHSSQSRGRVPLYLSLATHGLLAALLVPLGMRITPKTTPAAEQYQIAMVQVAGGSAMTKSPLMVAPNTDKKVEEHPSESRESGKPAPHPHHVPRPSGSEAKAARPQDLGTSTATGTAATCGMRRRRFPRIRRNRR